MKLSLTARNDNGKSTPLEIEFFDDGLVIKGNQGVFLSLGYDVMATDPDVFRVDVYHEDLPLGAEVHQVYT